MSLLIKLTPAWTVLFTGVLTYDTTAQTTGAPDQVLGNSFKGGMEISAGAQALRTFGRTSPAGHFEFAWRSAGLQADRQGRFSIGIAGMYHPSMASYGEVPHFIGHVRALNLTQPGRSEPVINVGGVDLRAKEVFLSTTDSPELGLSGFISFSPSGQEIMTLDFYKLRDVRMDMWGILVPLRWHFGRDGAKGPRFFAETGIGADVLRTQATYDRTRSAITLSYQQQFISFSSEQTTQQDVEPLDGKLSQNLIFTRLMFGGGVDVGRLRVFIRGQRSISASLEQSGQTYRRVRDNIFAVPVLAAAWDDQEVATTFAEGGVVPYGRTDIPRDTDNAIPAASSDRAPGVYRFWDRSQVILGLSIRLR